LLYHHLEFLSQKRFLVFQGNLFLKGHNFFQSLPGDFGVHLVRKRSRRGSFFGGIDKTSQPLKSNLPEKIQEFPESIFILSRKSYHNGGTKNHGRPDFAGSFENSFEPFPGILPVHPGKNPFVSMLHRDIRIGNNLGDFEKFFPKIFGNSPGMKIQKSKPDILGKRLSEMPKQSDKRILSGGKILSVPGNILTDNANFPGPFLHEHPGLLCKNLPGKTP